MDDKFGNVKTSNSGYLFEKIDLTELQIKKLESLQKLVTEAEERGEKSMLLAQVFPSMAELSVGFLPHEEAYHVLEIINPRGYQKAVKAGEYSNAKFMTPEEWRGLSAESRHKINLFWKEYERLKEHMQGVCKWTQDDEYGYWSGYCGILWELITDDPITNGMKYCPGCGKLLDQQSEPKHFDDDSYDNYLDNLDNIFGMEDETD